MINRWLRFGAVTLVVALAAGCTAGRAFRRGESATRAGDFDLAVTHYRQALQAEPSNANFRIALERAMAAASRKHLDQARVFEVRDELPAALREYNKANEFDPTNRQLAAKSAEIERKIRARIEAARPKPTIDQVKEAVRQKTQPPALVPTSRVPLDLSFPSASVKDVLNFIAAQSGINITFDPRFKPTDQFSIDLKGVTLEQALQQIMITNNLFYKVINEKTILVAEDNATNRGRYEDMVVRTFYVTNSDLGEIQGILNTVARPQGQPNVQQPAFAINKSAGAITVRGTAGQVAVIERIIELNDRPRAEIVIDVEILEVNRARAQQYGLSLSEYAIGLSFSPEQAPSADTTGATTVPPFNLNTISRGVNTADFYASVPSAVVRFLESDTETKLIAKPQLRGQEGMKLLFNLGEQVPVPSTTYIPFVTGGAATSPYTSFTYKDVGVNLEIEPKVTLEGEIILNLMVETSTVGPDVNIAGQNLPSFTQRRVTTKLRLRDGESNLLAGLLREDERRSLRGFPGILRLPVIRSLFTSNDKQITQTDVVMLLTPRVIRTSELTEADLMPINIGTAQNPTVGGPPPLLWQPPPETPPVVEAAAPPATVPAATPVPGAKATAAGIPAVVGASPLPGTVMVPAKPKEAPPTTIVTPPAQPPAQPPPAVQPPAQAPPAVQPPAQPPAQPPLAQPAMPPTGRGAAAPPAAAPLLPARIVITLPGAEFRVGAGPYTVPIMIEGASRVSTLSLSVSFNPAVLRVRTVQEGSFMRQGGVAVAFAQQVDPAAGRVDITLTRTTDVTGASGGGLLAAIMMEPVAAGTSPVGASGVATAPGGGALPLQFAAVTVTVK